MQSIPFPILHSLVQHVHNICPNTLFTLLFVNKQFYFEVKRTLHRHFTLFVYDFEVHYLKNPIQNQDYPIHERIASFFQFLCKGPKLSTQSLVLHLMNRYDFSTWKGI